MKRGVLILIVTVSILSMNALHAQTDTNKLRTYTPQHQPILQQQEHQNKNFENNSLFYNKDNQTEKKDGVPQSNGNYQQPGYNNPTQGTTPNTSTPGTLTNPSGNTNNINNLNSTK